MKYFVHIVCNEIQVKVNLEITTFFFYLRFPYCPNFFWFGVVLLLLKNLNYYSYTLLLLLLNEGFIQGSFLQKKKKKGVTSILSMEAMEQHKQRLLISSSITFLTLPFTLSPSPSHVLLVSHMFSTKQYSSLCPFLHSMHFPKVTSNDLIAHGQLWLLWEICSYVLRNNFGNEASMLSYAAVSAEFVKSASQQ